MAAPRAKNFKSASTSKLASNQNSVNKRVENALLQGILGYDVVEEKLVTIDGKSAILEVRKRILPNLEAAVTWLKTRCPNDWGLESGKLHSEDPFARYLNSINGCVLKPVENTTPDFNRASRVRLRAPEEDQSAPDRADGEEREE